MHIATMYHESATRDSIREGISPKVFMIFGGHFSIVMPAIFYLIMHTRNWVEVVSINMACNARFGTRPVL